MNDVIKSHENCPNHGYMWDFEIGEYDKAKPICYSTELMDLVMESAGEFPPVESLRSLKIVVFCMRGGSAVWLNDIGYCSGCRFFPENDKKAAEREYRE